MSEYHNELTRLAAECREAARWSRDFGAVTAMGWMIVSKLNLTSAAFDTHKPDDWERSGRIAYRLAENISRACHLAASCPDLMRNYLLAAADELETLAGAPAETETEESCPT